MLTVIAFIPSILIALIVGIFLGEVMSEGKKKVDLTKMTDAKLGYLKKMIRVVRENRSDIGLAFSCNIPYNIAVYRNMNPFGKSNSDALDFVKKVFAEVFSEVFSIVELDDGTILPVSNFNIEKYSFNVIHDSTDGCAIEVRKK